MTFLDTLRDADPGHRNRPPRCARSKLRASGDCSTCANRRKHQLGSDHGWMKVQWQVTQISSLFKAHRACDPKVLRVHGARAIDPAASRAGFGRGSAISSHGGHGSPKGGSPSPSVAACPG